MKRIICAALALTLLGSTAAEARGWHGGGSWHGRGYHHHGGGGDVALGVGLGFLALGIIAATSDNHRDRDDYYRDRDDSYRDRDGYRNDDRSGAYDNQNGPPRPLHQDDRNGDDDSDD
ncbi:MAG: hypothetical protein WDN01_12620 [Rhizomicrobium sp.]